MRIYEYADETYESKIYQYTQIMKGSKIIYPELSYKLNGIFYKVHNQLGRFCREKQYCDAIQNLLKDTPLKYEREKQLPVEILHRNTNKVDFIINNQILVEAKTKRYITREDYNQMKRYLKAAGLKLGIIVNFREQSIRPRRVINSEVKE